MPSDIGDLRDVVDAINKLCDTMKTSSYDEDTFEDCAQTVEPLLLEEILSEEAIVTEIESDPDWYIGCQIETSPDEVIFKKVEHYNTETWRQSVSRLEVSSEDVVQREERWSDSSVSLPGQESEHAQAPDECSEYHTASSASEGEGAEGAGGGGGGRRECAAGHVAAMRERFESMTRAATPAPDARDVASSPDAQG